MNFSSKRIIIVLGIVSLIILGGGYLAINRYFDTNPESNSPVQVEATSDSLKLVLSLNKTDYVLGENVTISLKLINVGNETVNIDFLTRSPPNWLRFKVFDQFNNLVYEGSLAAWTAGTIVALHPYGSMNQTLPWEHMTVDKEGNEKWEGDYMAWTHVWKQVDGTERKVPVGEYRIMGLLGSVYKPKIGLETPAIMVRIKGD